MIDSILQPNVVCNKNQNAKTLEPFKCRKHGGGQAGDFGLIDLMSGGPVEVIQVVPRNHLICSFYSNSFEFYFDSFESYFDSFESYFDHFFPF